MAAFYGVTRGGGETMRSLRFSLSSSASIFVAIFLIVSCSPAVLEGQVLYGSLVGNVTDPSGGVVLASVRLVNRGTGQSVEMPTNAAGLYTFTNVAAGTYDL